MRDPQGSLRDPFGRPSLESAADKALNDDLAFAAGLLPPRGAGRLAYGGKRRAGEAPRGSLSSHPAVQYGLPVRRRAPLPTADVMTDGARSSHHHV